MSNDFHFSTYFVPNIRFIPTPTYSNWIDEILDSENERNSLTHPSVIVAMQGIQTKLPPFVGREIWSPQAPHVDTELFVVHTILRVVELRICEEEGSRTDGDAKLLWAVDWLTRSIDQLAEDDYAFLDPLIAVRPTTLFDILRID